MFSVIISLCGKLICLPILILNSISKRWPIMRWPSHLGVRSGILGLILKGKGAARVWLGSEHACVF